MAMTKSPEDNELTNNILDMERRRNQLHNLRSLGVECYPARATRTTTIAEGVARIGLLADQENLAGRIQKITKTAPAQAVIEFSDQTGRLCVIADLNQRETATLAANLSVGDYIEASVVNEDSVYKATQLRLLTKSLRNAPTNPESNWEALLAGRFSTRTIAVRSAIFQQVRQFFYDAGFLEIDTPALTRCTDFDYLLHPLQGSFHAPDGLAETVYLNLSPEYLMKRALVSGFEKVFQITRFFRDGDISAIHNPEFQAVEWYEAYADYNAIMRRMEELIVLLARNVNGSTQLRFRDQNIDLTPPWPRLKVADALVKFAQVDSEAITGNHSALCRRLEAGGITNFNRDAPWETLFTKLVSEFVEPNLGLEKPTFLIDYPEHFEFGQMAKNTPNQNTVERFELYIAGLELCNGFSELNDPEEQERRFGKASNIMDLAHPVPAADRDNGFILALEYGIPPSGGVALGLDRLLMVFLDSNSISDVMLFPYQQLPKKNSYPISRSVK